MKTPASASCLPEIVTQFFAAANRRDASAAAACFADDAAVRDENHDHIGRAAIRRWVEETSRKYEPTFTLLAALPNRVRFLEPRSPDRGKRRTPADSARPKTRSGDRIPSFERRNRGRPASDAHLSLSIAVSGRFPGSPVTLEYDMRLQGGNISALTIE